MQKKFKFWSQIWNQRKKIQDKQLKPQHAPFKKNSNGAAALCMQYFYIVPYLGCWGLTEIEAGFPGLQLLSLNITKRLFYQDDLRTMLEYSTILVKQFVLLI